MSEPITIVQNAAVVFFPLDQRLKLTGQSLTPKMIEQALRMGIEIPSYRRAAEHFTDLTHVSLSKSCLQRLVDRYGGMLVELQATAATAMVKIPSEEADITWRRLPEPESECMNISMDGAKIHIRGEGWKEVKVATVSTVTHSIDDESGEWSTQLAHHSYRAGLWDAADFAKQQWAEACSRGVEKAQYVSSVNDGAAWIWHITRMCYGRCVEILDWWHAVERLWAIAHQHFGTESPDAASWVSVQKQLLADSQLRQVLCNIRQLFPREDALPETVRKAVVYFFHNRYRMRYKEFRAAGYPIGSGTVESACKVVVQTRLKQAGMRWSRNGAQAVLALRSSLLSDRWNQANALFGLA